VLASTQKAMLRGYFFFCANISNMQFGQSTKKFMGYLVAVALVVASGARAGTKIFDQRELISHASPLAVRG
jgi:uncharacterized membrane protein